MTLALLAGALGGRLIGGPGRTGDRLGMTCFWMLLNDDYS